MHTKKVLIIFCICVLGILAYIARDTLVGTSLREQISTKQVTSDTQTLGSFVEMTIPYLRARTYHSELGERTQIASNTAFTTYLTSYTSDGLRINALLTVPAGTAPTGGWPAVVFVHGYIPPTQYQTQEKYVEYVQGLARSGLVVMKIDLRGHGDSEGEPSGAYYSADYIIDTLNAYAALQQSGFVNPQQIGLWGHSMAGNIVLRSLAVKTDIPAAVVWAGAVYTYQDFLDYGIDDTSYQPPASAAARQRRRQELMGEQGQFTADSPFWSRVAVTNYLPDLKGAIQLHHAANDPVVSVQYSQNLAALLSTAGVKHEYYEYTKGGHNIASPEFSQAMSRTIEFYKKNLRY